MHTAMYSLLCVLFALSGASDSQQDAPSPDRPFVFAREVWSTPGNPTGNKVPNADFFSRQPTAVGIMASMESPSNASDNYVQRLRGWIEAPATGSYRFIIASDDHSTTKTDSTTKTKYTGNPRDS